MIYGGEIHFKIPKKLWKMLTVQIMIASLILLLTNTPIIPKVEAQEGETYAILKVDGYAYEQHQGQPDWGYTGANPYLNILDYPANYMSEGGLLLRCSGNYTFENLPQGTVNITSVILWHYADNDGAGNSIMYANYHFWNGSMWDDTLYDQKIQVHEADPWHYNSTDVLANGFIDNSTAMINGLVVYIQYSSPITSTPTCTIDYVFLNVTCNPPPPPPPPPEVIGDLMGGGIFLGGIIMMIYAPSWVAWKIKKSGVTPDTVERMGYAMLIFLLGLGLFLSYIYGGA